MPKVDFPNASLDVDGRFSLNTCVFVAQDGEGAGAAVQGPYRASLVVNSAPLSSPGASLQAYVDGEMKKLEKLEGFTQLGREEATTSSGAPAVLQRHVLTDARGTSLEQLQVFVAGPGAMWIGTATHVAGEPFRALEPSFRQMLLSLQPR